jgi:dTDP-6-deoxy-L-talose 4-dehydrogenase (NAD+)
LLAAGLKSLTVAGTCLEYGIREGELWEGMEASPDTAYGISKDRLRRWLEQRREQSAFGLTWGRIFYVYGEGQSERALLPQLAAAAKGTGVLDMSGGEQVRDFVPVTEVADALVRLTLGGGDHGVVNICSGRPKTVREQVEEWMEENGWELKLNLGRYPYPDYEAMSFWGSREKLKQCLS